jgi:predicted transcriptional regulator
VSARDKDNVVGGGSLRESYEVRCTPGSKREKEDIMLNITLEEIMCEHPIRVRESYTVGNAAHLLFRYRINGVLVVKDDDENELVGIFTTTELLRLIDRALTADVDVVNEFKRLSKLPLSEVVRKDVVFLQKNTEVIEAIGIMLKRNIYTIPVFDNEKLVGVVGRHDIINIALSQYEE